MTENRSNVTTTSRVTITTVTHQGKRSNHDRITSADPVSTLSAIGSTILPNEVTRLVRRASSPSTRSVIAAARKTTAAQVCQASDPRSNPTQAITTNTGTIARRPTVRVFGRFHDEGVG